MHSSCVGVSDPEKIERLWQTDPSSKEVYAIDNKKAKREGIKALRMNISSVLE